MENQHPSLSRFFILVLVFAFFFPFSIGQLSSETRLLFRVRRLLEYPPALSSWNNWTNFCYLPPSPSMTIVCSQNKITELSIVGNKGPLPSPPSQNLSQKSLFAVSPQSLSSAFSIDSLFTTLSKLSSLDVLSLVSLGLWGPSPTKIHRFSSLQVLNLSSNFIYGEIPPQVSSLTNLRSLVLDNNLFNGTVPDLSSLPGLEELDVGWNLLGPEFPSLGKTVVSVVLRNNAFRSNIPSELEHCDQMWRLDLSYNEIAGTVPSWLFSLPSIQYLNLAGNKLTGVLATDVSCGNQLGFVDLSRNLLVGGLPLCIYSNSSKRTVSYSWNCLSSGDLRYQHPYRFCQKEVALAAVMPPLRNKSSKSKLGLIIGIAGGVVGGVAALAILVWVILTRVGAKRAENGGLQKSITEKTPTRSPNIVSNAGAIGLPQYHVFTLEEIEEATNNFDPSNLIGEGSQGQLCKGRIRDGSVVVVRCLKLKQKQSIQSLTQHMEVISKLRHRHLVSILGHCIVTYPENPNASNTIFLVFEYISNGTLRSHISERQKQETLKWPQRLMTAIGVAKGLQFLHMGMVPGIFGNDIKIENILLDGNLTAKINGYNLLIPSKDKITKVGSESPFSRVEVDNHGSIGHGDKEDVHQLGRILLEVITGKTITSQSELDELKLQLQRSLTDAPTKLRAAADPSIRGTFAYESLRTAVEIAINCLSNNPSQRPSIEDVLWNLQYSVQVQEGWASSENLSTHS
ncbi:probable LRR receptor-like serine/threonine-protein kinase At1g14390 isoform X2 [Magnolia sinica]|uniref:probable LRR receptor-like serine/threonine-protein kinase At1g14390 isoform X2 n=1 Tax=Magnolia sinica TaxID=86752 RepID=UPI0026599751|nr:probable LRR receptor-like serine/threonine-protein kinase At1g14390 isoform X2 [Magnolia sinica]